MKSEELRAKKQLLRQSVRTIKASYSRQELEALSLSLLRALEQHPCFVQARTVLLYHSLPDEVCTHAFIDRWCAEKEIVLPTVVGDELELHLYTGPECLSTGSYGILERKAFILICCYSRCSFAYSCYGSANIVGVICR